MFAVIRTGGKQYRVVSDDVIKVERITGAAGDSVLFEDVLMVGDGDTTHVGAPGVSGASVAGQVVGEERGRKVIAFKKRRRTNSRRKRGHRQTYTVVRITEILTEGRKPSGEVKPRAPRAAKPKPAEGDEAAAAPKVAPARRRASPAAAAKPAAEKKPRARAKKAD